MTKTKVIGMVALVTIVATLLVLYGCQTSGLPIAKVKKTCTAAFTAPTDACPQVDLDACSFHTSPRGCLGLGGEESAPTCCKWS